MKIIILLLLMSSYACAQPNIHTVSEGQGVGGLFYLSKDQTIKMNQDVVEYLTVNLDNIISIGGKTKISIATEKEFKRRLRMRFVDGFLVQYAWTGVDISLQKPRSKIIEFDFDKKLIDKKRVIVANDTVKVKKDKGLFYYFKNEFFEGTGKFLTKAEIGETKQNDNDDHFKPSDTKLKDTVKSKDEKENKKPDITPGGKKP